MNEENALSSGKEATEARVAERKLELSQLRTEIEEREKSRRFRKSKGNLQKLWVHCLCYCPCRLDCHWRCYKGDNNLPETTGQRHGKSSARC